MTEIIKNLDALFQYKEKEYYNRYFKKIYKGRISKAADKKYSLEEYEKQFRFETKFILEMSDNYQAFITFFERNDKLGHSMSSTIRLLPKGMEYSNTTFELVSPSKRATKNEKAPIKKRIKKIEAIISDAAEDLKDGKIKWNKHFSLYKHEELVTEYAAWKAKKRFLAFLHSELTPLQSPESISDTAEQETSLIKNPEHTTRRQTLAIYYLDVHLKINHEGKSVALGRFIQFLTDKNMDNIIKTLRNPLKNTEKKKIKADQELLKDLKYIRVYFEDLGLMAIVKQIDKDIAAVSEDEQ